MYVAVERERSSRLPPLTPQLPRLPPLVRGGPLEVEGAGCTAVRLARNAVAHGGVAAAVLPGNGEALQGGPVGSADILLCQVPVPFGQERGHHLQGTWTGMALDGLARRSVRWPPGACCTLSSLRRLSWMLGARESCVPSPLAWDAVFGVHSALDSACSALT